MASKYGDDKTELIKLPPMLLYDIATDIQVTDKWRQFAMLIGFTNDQIAMLQLNSGERFPAENVIYHWFSRNPKVNNLADHLCTLSLERTLKRLQVYLSPTTYKALHDKLETNRNNFTRPISNETVTDGYLESIHTIHTPSTSTKLVMPQPSSNASTNYTTNPSTPEPGIVDVALRDPSIPRSLNQENDQDNKEKLDDDNQSDKDPTYTLIHTMLKQRSIQFYPEEFVEIDSVNRSLQGQFSSNFNFKLRSNNFYIHAYNLDKMLNSMKKKKKLYRIIWFLTNFRLNYFPLLTGFSFYENYLFLIFPSQKSCVLYDILHRPHDTDIRTISAKDRINILVNVGEALAFLHESRPFSGFHGQVNSHNVLISHQNAVLTGFEKFCTQQPSFQKGLEIIQKQSIDFEDLFRRDKLQYLELICETWWNVQPSNINSNDSCLIKDIVHRKIVQPKQKYSDWSDQLNDHIRDVVEQFCETTKDLGSIAEIVDQLSGEVQEPIQSLEPPPYESCTEVYQEYRFEGKGSDSDN